jgi:hypothetical protein
MKSPILFQSLDRIDGKEGKSKLLHNESELYQVLKQLKVEISKHYAHKGDRMDLHIELTKERRDEKFREKAESMQGIEIDLSNSENWGYLNQAFVLWTPEIKDYGRTHATVTFFGEHERAPLLELQSIVAEVLKRRA